MHASSPICMEYGSFSDSLKGPITLSVVMTAFFFLTFWVISQADLEYCDFSDFLERSKKKKRSRHLNNFLHKGNAPVKSDV